ncbi:MAG: methyltransferase domain-containing protein [Chlorobiaceae bacterium]|nr:methyltransferase domain-containing protein [Chlorobiaceae bacterium]
MLQLRTTGYRALDRLRARGEFPPEWNGPQELETATDRFMQRFMEERLEASGELGPGFHLFELLDRAVRCPDTENMDSDSMTGDGKAAMVEALDRMNGLTMAYRHQIGLLEPLLHELSQERVGPVRVLELAAGSGGLAFALAEYARKKGLRLQVTASDIVPELVEAGRAAAAERGLEVAFRVVNAFDLAGIGRSAFDLVVVSQSLHHFSPGKLALMIAGAGDLGASAFVGIDGHRSLLLLAGVPIVASLQGMAEFTADAFTSSRKFYSDLELDIIAEIATGRRSHQVECSWPMSMLTVRTAP